MPTNRESARAVSHSFGSPFRHASKFGVFSISSLSPCGTWKNTTQCLLASSGAGDDGSAREGLARLCACKWHQKSQSPGGGGGGTEGGSSGPCSRLLLLSFGALYGKPLRRLYTVLECDAQLASAPRVLLREARRPCKIRFRLFAQKSTWLVSFSSLVSLPSLMLQPAWFKDTANGGGLWDLSQS
jgi:hypothetical protein